jgi:putative peptidoglycan lipid II flippase
MTSPSQSTANRQISRAAGTVMAAIICSNLIGLVRSMIIANAYGTSPELEAFNAANRVGELLFNLMAGGALASAFVPTFTGLLVKEQREAAWKLAGSIANLLFVILTAASLLAMFFAPWIVDHALAKGFSPEMRQLTVQILRVLLPSVIIFGISGLVMGILNSHQKFLIPALTPSMYSVGIILGVLLLRSRIGIFGLAWGAIIGAILHLLLQLPALFSLKGNYSLTFGLKNPLVSNVGWLMLPRLFGAGIVQLNFWMNTLLCTFQGAATLGNSWVDRLLALWLNNLAIPFNQGSLNGLTYSFALMLMPQAVIAQSIAIASMPTFAAQVSLDQFDDFRHSLASSLRAVLMLSVPASIGLVMLRIPIVALLYQRGNFSTESTALVAWPLLWYAAGLVGHSLVEVLSRAFYALHNTKTPVIIGALAMTLNIILSMIFSAFFSRMGWMPHGGLALANSLATALEMVGLLILLRRRLVRMEGKRIGQILWQACLAGGSMALVLFAWQNLSAQYPVWIQALAGILLGAGVYVFILWLLKVPELFSLVRGVMRRLLPSTK